MESCPLSGISSIELVILCQNCFYEQGVICKSVWFVFFFWSYLGVVVDLDDGAVCAVVSSASGTISLVTRWTGTITTLYGPNSADYWHRLWDCMRLGTKAALGQLFICRQEMFGLVL